MIVGQHIFWDASSSQSLSARLLKQCAVHARRILSRWSLSLVTNMFGVPHVCGQSGSFGASSDQADGFTSPPRRPSKPQQLQKFFSLFVLTSELSNGAAARLVRSGGTGSACSPGDSPRALSGTSSRNSSISTCVSATGSWAKYGVSGVADCCVDCSDCC